VKTTLLRRFLRNKRALTPVLSELLLTVVAVAAMSVAATATFVITTNMKESMSERLTVEDVFFNSGVSVDVYLNNVGKVDINVASVYINHTSQFFNSPFKLEIGEHGWLSIVFSERQSDAIYYIDIVTDRGTHVAGYYKAT